MNDQEKVIDIKVNWRALKGRVDGAFVQFRNPEFRARASSAFLSICLIAGSVVAYSLYENYLDSERVIGQISCGNGQNDNIFFEEDGVPLYQSEKTVASEAELWYGPARDSRRMAIPGSYDVVINNRGVVSARSNTGDERHPITHTSSRGNPFKDDNRYSVENNGDIKVGSAIIHTEPREDYLLEQLCDQVVDQYSQGGEVVLADGSAVETLPDNPTLAQVDTHLLDYGDQQCPGWEFATLAPWNQYTLSKITANPIASGAAPCED